MADHLLRATASVQQRWRMLRTLSASLLLGSVFAAGALVLFGLDNLFHLGVALRVILGAGFLLTMAFLAVRHLIVPLMKPVTPEEAAILIERAFPELDNRLINASRLSRDVHTPAIVLTMIHEEAGRMVAALDLRNVLPVKSVKPLAMAAGAALLLLLIYAVALPDYFVNAVKRYAMPAAFTPPITRTMLNVSPGTVTIVEGNSVVVRADVSGEIPSTALIQCGKSSYDMRFLGGCFQHEFKGVDAAFDYCVKAGDAESQIYHVTVLGRTKVEKLVIAYSYPPYLKLPPHTDDPSAGNIATVEGTEVAIAIKTNKALKKINLVSDCAANLLRKGEQWTFTVNKTGAYHFEWTDADNLEGKSSDYTVTSMKDTPPRVRIVEPSRDTTMHPSGTLSVLLHGDDDFGLECVRLGVCRIDPKADKDAFIIAEFAAKGKDLRASRQLTPNDVKGKTGETVKLFAVARDLKGNETYSSTVAVKIIDENQAKQDVLKELGGVVARLRQVITWQKTVRDQTVENKTKTENLAVEQSGILKTLAEIYGSWTNPELKHMAARTRLENAIRGPAARAVEQLRMDRKAASVAQSELIKELEAICAELEGVTNALKTADLEKTLADAADKTPKQIAKDLLAGLKEFSDAQKKIIEDTMDLKPKAGEDFSDDAKKKLDTLRQTEEQWGKFMQEKLTDLSKVPPQDFSNGNLSKELNAVSSEIKKAADALAQKSTELAIPAEESGLELAKEITSNIERWLADAPDNQKWNMEENMKDVDVPMADLPAELEDIMGDLIDKEDKLAEESQDVTSSWMDSMDKGVGWGVADGPIANMSAKGITGNLQPNSNEIAGRSGEGRSGKSSGQFVGDTAQGKGGKQTPTRSTPDPYEAGQVKDSSKDPSGGSTGGGKISGANKEGLRGQPPPQTMQKMDRMADTQADIRNTAEKAKVAMEKRGYVSQDLAAAVERMRLVEDKLRNHQGSNYTSDIKAVTKTLSGVKKSVGDQMDVLRDPTRSVTKEKRTDFKNGADEDIPPEFKDWVKAYYKALSD
jgi:phage host-nuclease inhibitor protein Gam